MKNILIVVCLFCCTCVFGQPNYHECLEYLTTNYPKSSWTIQDNSDGKGIFITNWVSELKQPTLADCSNIWSSAKEFKKKKSDAKIADFKTWNKPELKALVLVLIDEINILRNKVGLDDRSPAQLEAAIKAKL